jgi:WD40 repeat protein
MTISKFSLSRPALLGSLLLVMLSVSLNGRIGLFAQPSAEKIELREIRTEDLNSYVLAFDVANASDLAAAALSDLSVHIWKLSNGTVVHVITLPMPETDQRLKLDGDFEPISLRFSPDGKALAVAFVSAIRIYDVETWQEQKSLAIEGENDLRSDVTVTPQTPQLQHRTSEQAQAEKDKPALTLNEGTKAWFAQMARGDGRTRITDFAFTPNGTSILAAYCKAKCYARPGRRWMAFPSGKDPVRLWDLGSNRVIWEREYDPKGVFVRVVIAPDNRRFATVDAERGHCAVQIYQMADGGEASTLPFNPLCDPPPNIAFLENGQLFLTNRADDGDRQSKRWRNLAIYETNTGKRISDFSDSESVHSFDMSSDGRWLASTTWSGLRFQVWDVSAKKPLTMQTPKAWRWKGPPIDRVRFSPDGKWLIVAGDTVGKLVIYQFGSS